MPTVDFAEWVEPNLDVALGGGQYSCPPPSVAKAKIIVALAVLAEVRLGLVPGPPDAELVALVDSQSDSLSVITLGSTVYNNMVADGVTQTTIDRVGYYALHYWARGKAQADWLAAAMWAPDAAEPSPKTSPRRRSQSGPSTASGSRTKTASTPTTGSPPA